VPRVLAEEPDCIEVLAAHLLPLLLNEVNEVKVSAISCTKLAVASKLTAWPAPSICWVLAVGMAAASDRTKPTMLVGLRAP
jgi:hypothetical protein